MSDDEVKDMREVVDAVHRSDSHQVRATLIHLLRDFDTIAEQRLRLDANRIWIFKHGETRPW